MKDTYGLDALSRIQALEAEPAVRAFRDEFLGGRTLSPQEASEWLSAQVQELVEADCGPCTIAMPYLSKVGYRADGTIRTREVSWWAAGDHWWEEGIRPRKGSALCRTGSLCADLAHDFGREWWYQGLDFVLSGELVELSGVVVHEDPPVNAFRRLSGPALSSGGFASPAIVLRCRMTATVDEVRSEYRRALEECRHTLGHAARARNRSLSSERTRDLAVFGARVLRGDFRNWGSAMIEYQREYPDDATYAGATDHGKFRRDVRRAFTNVTGSDLTWEPKRTGQPAVAATPTGDGRQWRSVADRGEVVLKEQGRMGGKATGEEE